MPILWRPWCAPVAQGTEQEPSKLLVGGSNPSGGAPFGFAERLAVSTKLVSPKLQQSERAE